MIFATLRMIGLLRRGVRALESLASSQSALAQSVWAREKRIRERQERRKSPSKTSFETLDTQSIEDAYQMRQRAEGFERE